MAGRTSLIVVAAIALTLGCLSANCYCGEHPEHPTAKPKSEGLTKDQLADAIEAYIKKEAAAHDGNFPIDDKKSGEKLQLKLVKVHRERLAKVGGNEYFACVDFNDAGGKVYDVDFFMKGADKDKLKFSEFMIHKVNGKERYTWYEKDGVWKRKPVDDPAKVKPKKDPNEHPKEHPSEHPK